MTLKTCHILTSCLETSPVLADTVASWRRLPFRTRVFVVAAKRIAVPDGTHLVVVDESAEFSRALALNVGARAALNSEPAEYLFFIDPRVKIVGPSLLDKALAVDPDFVLSHDSTLQTGGRSFAPAFWRLMGTHLVRSTLFQKTGGYDVRLEGLPDPELYVRYAKLSSSYSILDVSQLAVLEGNGVPLVLPRWRQWSRYAQEAFRPWTGSEAKSACDRTPYVLTDASEATGR